jgi:hypothetical protein
MTINAYLTIALFISYEKAKRNKKAKKQNKNN